MIMAERRGGYWQGAGWKYFGEGRGREHRHFSPLPLGEGQGEGSLCLDWSRELRRVESVAVALTPALSRREREMFCGVAWDSGDQSRWPSPRPSPGGRGGFLALHTIFDQSRWPSPRPSPRGRGGIFGAPHDFLINRGRPHPGPLPEGEGGFWRSTRFFDQSRLPSPRPSPGGRRGIIGGPHWGRLAVGSR